MYIMFISGPTSPLVHSCQTIVLAKLANSDFGFSQLPPTPPSSHTLKETLFTQFHCSWSELVRLTGAGFTHLSSGCVVGL